MIAEIIPKFAFMQEKKNKKKVLVFSDWFLPGYKAGGPIRSVSNLVRALSEVYDFTVVTSDRDLGDPVPYPGVVVNTFSEHEAGCRIIYLSPGLSSYRKIWSILRKHHFDKVYLNSLFSVRFSLFPLLCIKLLRQTNKTVLAPRGMLGRGALEIKSFKKKIFLKASLVLGLFKSIQWHSTDEEETKEIKSFFGKNARVKMALNISTIEKERVEKSIGNEIRFVFLSRISQIKNLLYAIESFSGINFSKNIVFDIYGTPEEENYIEVCKQRAAESDISAKINFYGSVKGPEVVEKLSNYHFFFLPTKHENYGHVIFEALSAGCPVILSTNTPWRHLQSKAVGWDIDLKDKSKYKDVLKTCSVMSNEDYRKMSESAYKYAEQTANNPALKEQSINLFA